MYVEHDPWGGTGRTFATSTSKVFYSSTATSRPPLGGVRRAATIAEERPERSACGTLAGFHPGRFLSNLNACSPMSNDTTEHLEDRNTTILLELTSSDAHRLQRVLTLEVGTIPPARLPVPKAGMVFKANDKGTEVMK